MAASRHPGYFWASYAISKQVEPDASPMDRHMKESHPAEAKPLSKNSVPQHIASDARISREVK
jgi:hypothetical protein